MLESLTRATPVRALRVGCSRRWLHSPTRRTPQPPSPEVVALLQNYSDLPARQVTLRELLSFGEDVTQDSVVASAAFVLEELPRRLSQRVRSMGSLPFIVGTNPFISRTHKLHMTSFQALASYPAVRDLESNWAFTRHLEDLVESHSNDIPTMAKGFQESIRYMSSAAISTFLDEAIRSRIGVRLIAEQHIALSHSIRSQDTKKPFGIVHKQTSPADMVKMCSRFVSELCEATLGAAPPLILEGDLDATFPYVPVHLEYILTEILKNSFRATVEHHSNATELPPIVVTISPSPYPATPLRPSYMSIRIRDEGGGVSPANMKKIFSYAFTTAGQNVIEKSDDVEGGPYAAQYIGGLAAMGGETGAGEGNLFGEITGKGLQTGLGSIAGLGYGLPLARLYASYFGAGSGLELVSLHRYGTDVFIKLRCLDHEGGGEVLI
ncbi:26S proteasome regulatory subunit 7 [Tulasnella sp. 419]|nr:26S proteasome regulatory subunit 7 [Tulasnella sp. 418]KAG8951549.1 26S proteasome regulatory subunit 7 [Tulasnella sp. 419]